MKGFAIMDVEKRKEIARKGGISSQKSGRGHSFTKEEAVEAGKKGGMARRNKKLSTVEFA